MGAEESANRVKHSQLLLSVYALIFWTKLVSVFQPLHLHFGLYHYRASWYVYEFLVRQMMLSVLELDPSHEPKLSAWIADIRKARESRWPRKKRG